MGNKDSRSSVSPHRGRDRELCTIVSWKNYVGGAHLVVSLGEARVQTPAAVMAKGRYEITGIKAGRVRERASVRQTLCLVTLFLSCEALFFFVSLFLPRVCPELSFLPFSCYLFI